MTDYMILFGNQTKIIIAWLNSFLSFTIITNITLLVYLLFITSNPFLRKIKNFCEDEIIKLLDGRRYCNKACCSVIVRNKKKIHFIFTYFGKKLFQTSTIDVFIQFVNDADKHNICIHTYTLKYKYYKNTTCFLSKTSPPASIAVSLVLSGPLKQCIGLILCPMRCSSRGPTSWASSASSLSTVFTGLVTFWWSPNQSHLPAHPTICKLEMILLQTTQLLEGHHLSKPTAK